MNKILLSFLFTTAILINWSCKKETSAGTSEKIENHDGHDHAGHDHSGHDHAGHDHSGHDHSGHDHSGHDHAQKEKQPTNGAGEFVSEEEMKKRQEELKKKFEEARNKPITKKQKATGDAICDCLKDLPLFSLVKNAKSQEEFFEASKNAALSEVQAMQNCHTTNMREGFKHLKGAERGIYSFKAREYSNKQCLGGNDNLWLYMGKFVSANTELNPQ